MRNDVHPSVIVGPDVHLGANNIIGPNVVLLGPLEIGDSNWIGPGVVIGSPPEVRSAPHEALWNATSNARLTKIGSRNIIREGVSIQRSNYRHTTIGDDCFIMSRAYIAHDCVIGDEVTISANVSLAGHCVIQSKSTLGLASTFHQFSVVGSGAMVGMSAAVTRDVPPYAMFYGVPGSIKGANSRGMAAHGFDTVTIENWESSLTSNGKDATSDDAKIIDYLTKWEHAKENVHLKDHEKN